MEIKAIQISEVLSGEIVGNPNVAVNKLSKIEEGTPGAITFLANPKYKHHIYTTEASVVIVSNDFVPENPIKATLIKVENPYSAFTQLLEYYYQMRLTLKVGIDEKSSISSSAKIGENVFIGAFVSVGDNVVIGDNVKIYPNVTIAENTIIKDNVLIYSGVNIYSESVIGNNCVIHSGAVIGSDGFGFAPLEDGSYKKIPQIGNVVLEDNVEVGANATIDRATLGSTIIKQGVKLDNLVQVAHNVEVGENTVIASQSGVAGSSKIGKNCVIGGQVGIAGHLSVGDQVKIQAQSGVSRNVQKGEVLQGTPALKYMEYNKSYVIFKKLPQLEKEIQELKKQSKNEK